MLGSILPTVAWPVLWPATPCPPLTPVRRSLMIGFITGVVLGLSVVAAGWALAMNSTLPLNPLMEAPFDTEQPPTNDQPLPRIFPLPPNFAFENATVEPFILCMKGTSGTESESGSVKAHHLSGTVLHSSLQSPFLSCVPSPSAISLPPQQEQTQHSRLGVSIILPIVAAIMVVYFCDPCCRRTAVDTIVWAKNGGPLWRIHELIADTRYGARLLSGRIEKLEKALEEQRVPGRIEKLEKALEEQRAECRTLMANCLKLQAGLQTKADKKVVESSHDQFAVGLQQSKSAIDQCTKDIEIKCEKLQKTITEKVSPESMGCQAEWTLDGHSFQDFGFNQPVRSPTFGLAGIQGLRLCLYPHGCRECPDGTCGLFLEGPEGVEMQFLMTLDGSEAQFDYMEANGAGGWIRLEDSTQTYQKATLEVFDVRRRCTSSVGSSGEMVVFDRPSWEARIGVLEVALEEKAQADDVDLADLERRFEQLEAVFSVAAPGSGATRSITDLEAHSEPLQPTTFSTTGVQCGSDTTRPPIATLPLSPAMTPATVNNEVLVPFVSPDKLNSNAMALHMRYATESQQAWDVMRPSWTSPASMETDPYDQYDSSWQCAEWIIYDGDGQVTGEPCQVRSPEFSIAGVEGLQLSLTPWIDPDGNIHCAVYLYGPACVLLNFQVTLDGHMRASEDFYDCSQGHGWSQFGTTGSRFNRAIVQILGMQDFRQEAVDTESDPRDSK